MRISANTAKDILSRCHAHGDFHALNSDVVECLLSFAREMKYYKPKNANGSRARYFHAYLTRAANREEK